MEKLTHHPLRAQEDALKRTLILDGFTLIDDDAAPELEPADWAVALFQRPDDDARKPMLVEGGAYAMRSELLAAQLSGLRGPLPIRAFAAGTVYDGRDVMHPQHRCIQGVWVGDDLPMRECKRFGELLVESVFGVGARTDVRPAENGSTFIDVTLDDRSFTFAVAGKATPLARALLGLSGTDATAWFFEIDVDAVTMATYRTATRDDLYSPLMSHLAACRDDTSAFGSLYASRASNTLRAMGFCEFVGLHVYEEDCYRKMNMIQEAWDANNAGVQLVEPLGAYTGLPTVLTPALEEALAANWAAGEESCRIFERRHIFLPGTASGAPIEKVALSFGGYAPDLDAAGWRKVVDEFLTRFGISNHFFIPLPPGKAPAYHAADGWLLMDEHMTYLESNFGSISPTALGNHGIGTQAFMAQFEFAPIERKAAEEFDFVLPDYQ